MEIQHYNHGKQNLMQKIELAVRSNNVQDICDIASTISCFHNQKSKDETDYESTLFYNKTKELFLFYGSKIEDYEPQVKNDISPYKGYYRQFMKKYSTWTILDYVSFANSVMSGSVIVNGEKVEYKTYGKITYHNLLSFADIYDEVIAEARVIRERKKTSQTFKGDWNEKVVELLKKIPQKIESEPVHKFYKMSSAEITAMLSIMTDDQLKKEKASSNDPFVQNLIKEEIIRRFDQ